VRLLYRKDIPRDVYNETRLWIHRRSGNVASQRFLAGFISSTVFLAGTGDRIQNHTTLREASVLVYRPDSDGHQFLAETAIEALRNLSVHHGPVPLLQGESTRLAKQHQT